MDSARWTCLRAEHSSYVVLEGEEWADIEGDGGRGKQRDDGGAKGVAEVEISSPGPETDTGQSKVGATGFGSAVLAACMSGSRMSVSRALQGYTD